MDQPRIKKSHQREKKAWNKFKYVRSPKNYSKYLETRNKTTAAIQKAQKQQEYSVAVNIKERPKLCWQHVRRKMKSKTGIGTLKTDGVEYQDDNDKAQCLSNFFSSVFTEESDEPLPEMEVISSSSTIDQFTVSEEDLLNKMNHIKVDKSAGPDEIYPRILKECKGSLTKPLLLLFNKSLATGVLPRKWKEAVVVPIFKKGNRWNPSNYRPASLTSIVAKLLESIIRDQIVSFLELNRIIIDSQFGFTKGKSCALQLLSVVDKWTESLDRGRSMDVLYTDFRKAFDSVAHRHLIYNLQSVGIKNKALKWCKSFLEERTQRVRVENAMSNSIPVTSSVPQGSVLGPVLFIIYINDIVAQAEKSNGNLFADDAKFDLAVDNENDRDDLQNDINNITRWSEEWKMSFNYDKCKILHVGKIILVMNTLWMELKGEKARPSEGGERSRS